MKETKERAEKAYKGITKKWVTVAKPNEFKKWPGDLSPFCSFCGRSIFEVHGEIFRGKNAHICSLCIAKYDNIIKTIKERLNKPIEADRG